jgi:hypothetical protein
MSAAERLGLNEAWVLRNLRLNAVMAMRAGDRSAANRALEILAKHLGMLVERKQINIAYVDDADEYLERMMKLIAQPVLEAERVQPLSNGKAQPLSNSNGGLDDGLGSRTVTDVE